MHRTTSVPPIAAPLLLLLAGCRDSAELPEEADAGSQSDPVARRRRALIPTLNIAHGEGLAAGRHACRRATGLRSAAFATGLDHPRWLYVLPNGDVLVAETNAPPKAAEGRA